MILSLKSNGPDYYRIRANIQIPWNCQYIEYYVAAINTKNVLLISHDDSITYEWDDNDLAHTHHVSTMSLEDRYYSLPSDIPDLFNVNDANGQPIMNVQLNNNTNVIKLTPHVDNFTITSMSHRIALITGLYNTPLNQPLANGRATQCDIPIIDYANKLYLISKQGQAIQSNLGDVEYTPSVIASIDHIIRYGLPIIQNFETYGKPIKNVVNIDSFKQIELELVDFEYQPVKLMSPMFVTIKVNPCDPPKMKL